MKSLELAIKKLKAEELSFILVKEGVVLKKSREPGIMPILSVYEEGVSLFEGGAVADRVIGRAAAILLREGKISNVFSEVATEEAIEILTKEGINIFYDKKVDTILKKDKADLYPVEELAKGEESGIELARKICEYYKISLAI